MLSARRETQPWGHDFQCSTNKQLADLSRINEVGSRLVFNVLKGASGRSIRNCFGPINSHDRIDRCSHVFNIDRPLLVPTWVCYFRANLIGRSNNTAPQHSRSRKKSGKGLLVMVSPFVHSKFSGGSAKLGDTADRSFLQQCAAIRGFGVFEIGEETG